MIEPKTILTDATNAIYGDRNDTHGDFADHFETVSEFWTVFLRGKLKDGEKVTPSDVCVLMTLLKVGRIQTGAPIKDHFVDAVGYLSLAAGVLEE